MTIREYIMEYAKKNYGFSLYELIAHEDQEYKIKDIRAELEKMATLKNPLLIRKMDNTLGRVVYRYYLPKTEKEIVYEPEDPAEKQTVNIAPKKPVATLEGWC